MQIQLNGKSREYPEGTTIADLLAQLQLADRRGVGVECNDAFVPPTEHATRQLAEGDAVEVVRLIGGG